MLDGVMGRCEATGHCSFLDESCGANGFRYHSSAGTQAGICLYGLPAGAILELPAIDLADAPDRVTSSCAPEGAREHYVELFTMVAQTLTFETFGPDPRAPVVLSLRDGACPPGLAEISGCRAPVCGDAQTAHAVQLTAPGSYCLVIEQADPAAAGTTGVRIVASGRDALVIDRPTITPPPLSTCGGLPDPDMPSCTAPTTSPATSVVFVTCPGTRLRTTITPDPGDDLDIALSLRTGDPRGGELACANAAGVGGPELLDTPATGLTWLMIDRIGGAGTCGDVSVTYQLGP